MCGLVGPLLCEGAVAREPVAVPVRDVDAVAIGVSQGELAYLPRYLGEESADDRLFFGPRRFEKRIRAVCRVGVNGGMVRYLYRLSCMA